MMPVSEAVHHALFMSRRVPGSVMRSSTEEFIAELGEQGYRIVPVAGPVAWRDPTSGTSSITPHEQEVNEVVEAGRILLRHGADPGNVRWAVQDTLDSIGLAPDGEASFFEAVFRS